MATHSRQNKTNQGYFDWEYFYVRGSQECKDCPKSSERPEGDHFHCLVCHSNKKVPRRDKIGNELKKHYIKYSEEGSARRKSAILHDLTNPPRQVGTDFESLTANEKTLVREGKHLFVLFHSLIRFKSLGIFAFHGAVHGQSFNSQVCLSELMSKVVDPNYANSASKSAAINKGVFAQLAQEKLQEELDGVRHVTVSFDCSTIQNHKLLPIFVTFFDRQGGLQHRLLDLVDLNRETGLFVAIAIDETMKRFGIRKKVRAICADNCPTNYGSVNRQGDNNVFAILKDYFGDLLIGIGCLAHVLNNALKNAAETIKLGGQEFSKILALLNRYFEREKGRSAQMIRLMVSLGYKDAYTNKKPTKSYCHTRWLSTGPAIEAIVQHFDAFYFHFEKVQEGKHVDKFKAFFQDEDTWIWLVILRSIASEFEEAILEIEGSGVTLISAIKTFTDLRTQVLFLICNLIMHLIFIYSR